jgi:hypothetical protein
MVRRVSWLVAFAGVVLIAPLSAQDKRIEVSVLAGWTFSDGVSTDDDVPFQAPDGNQYNRIDPEDSFKWGFTGGFLVTPNMEIGFQYGQQNTTLRAGGLIAGMEGSRPIGDLSVATYHGYFNYNFLDDDAPVRPYAMFGLGATHYGSVDFDTALGRFSTTPTTQFSSTWGVGVKLFPRPNFGIRAGAQWTPTYIKTSIEGWWCDPNADSGCYVVGGDPQYSSQVDLSGGVIFRF